MKKFINLFCLEKKPIITACVITSLLLAFTLIFTGRFFQREQSYGVLLYITAIFLCLLTGVTALLKLPEKGKSSVIIPLAVTAVMPLVTITMSEALNYVFVYNMYYYAFISGYILILLLCCLVYTFCGSIKVSLISVNVTVYLLSMANYYVTLFRGTPFLPMDFLSISTATNVAVTYNYTPSFNVIISTVLIVFIVVLSTKLKTPKLKLSSKVISRAVCFALFSIVFSTFYFTNFFADTFKLKPDFWNQSRGYRQSGVTLSFFMNVKYLYVSAPSDYNANKIEDIMNSYIDRKLFCSEPESTNEAVKKPNVICIMNESFADLSVVGDFDTNVDYMPFYRSLCENTVKGNLTVPVKGSGTSNSEFEFLTGCSMNFYPSGSNAYSLYIKDKLDGLVSNFSKSGYKNIAFHPYYSSGWNRTNVYKYLGFSRFDSYSSVIDADIVNNAVAKPKEEFINEVNERYGYGNNILIRQYVSDSCNYEHVISKFEERNKNSPLFLFNVTMQNHGGYSGEFSNFTNDVYLTGSDGADFPLTNNYLSLMKKSDDALKELITYFESIDEPTVICFFGDHQPSIEQSFYEKLLGKSLYSLTPEEEQRLYITPFFIWANYDIEEKQIDYLSSNYLSSMLLKVIGGELSSYNKYLLSMCEKFPVISTVGYRTSDGECHSWNEKAEYKKAFSDYEKIQYNYLFDKKNRKKELFCVK